MTDITVCPFNATYDLIACDDSVAQDIYDYFSYTDPNGHFIKMKRPNLKNWDGKVHLFQKARRKLYCGLRHRIEKFATDRGLSIDYDYYIEPIKDVDYNKAERFIGALKLPEHIVPHDYQIKTFVECIRRGRVTVLSPTGSGKSLIIYMLSRFYNRKTLVIVPTIGLVQQLESHFREYGFKGEMHQIYAGQEKNDRAQIYVSTWQSLVDLPKEYFAQFGMVIVDEVHGAEAKSLKSIMEGMEQCDIRFGFTGTLKDLPTHRLIIEGLFGGIYELIKTHELIAQGVLTPLEIKVMLLKYADNLCKIVSFYKYPDELEFIVTRASRKRFINNLVASLKGNTLVLFRLVELQGKGLVDDLKRLLGPNRPVYFIYGATPILEREQIRQILATQNNAVLVGSYGCVSTGLDAPTLRHLICASPYRSKIKVLQSIGRMLRKAPGKTVCTVYDIADDLTYKGKQNFTLQHCIERIRIYNEEHFNYKTFKLELKD